MKRTIALLCASLGILALATVAFAQKEHPRAVTPAEKQASDANVSAALQQEQAALAAMSSSGGAGTASADLQTAVSDLHAALPIYHGYRVKSMHACDNAIKQLARTPKNPAKWAARISGIIQRAITDAQSALANSSSTITPDDKEPGAG